MAATLCSRELEEILSVCFIEESVKMAATLCSRELEEILSVCFIEESIKMAATLCSREFGEAHEEAGCGLSVNL